VKPFDLVAPAGDVHPVDEDPRAAERLGATTGIPEQRASTPVIPHVSRFDGMRRTRVRAQTSRFMSRVVGMITRFVWVRLELRPFWIP
jgi:hypothetical protein